MILYVFLLYVKLIFLHFDKGKSLISSLFFIFSFEICRVLLVVWERNNMGIPKTLDLPIYLLQIWNRINKLGLGQRIHLNFFEGLFIFFLKYLLNFFFQVLCFLELSAQKNLEDAGFHVLWNSLYMGAINFPCSI